MKTFRLLVLIWFATVTMVQATIVRGPYLSCATQTSIIVTWTTSSAGISLIRYGKTTAYSSSFIDTNPLTVHSFALQGLLPSTLYHYQVITGNDSSADYTFQTAPLKGESFSFHAYGDTRTNHTAHVGVLQRMAQYPARFVLNSGDLVESNTVANWDNYFSDLCKTTAVGASVPFYSSPGNHEFGTMYYDNLYLPHNNPSNVEDYYSFDFGSVHVISINTEVAYTVGTAQYNWLVSDLASQEKAASTFTIAFLHRPPYSSSNHGSDTYVRAAICPLLEAAGVDIVLNGHDHDYERTTPFGKTTYIVTGGGGAPLYDWKTTNAWTAYREKAYHFCWITVDSTSLKLFMIRDDGAIRDSLTIIKPVTNVFPELDLRQPASLLLEQNYPNPFNPSTIIRFSIADAGNVSLSVFDEIGRMSATLVNKYLPAGRYAYQWDASNVPGGIYFVRLQSRGFSQTKKILYVR